MILELEMYVFYFIFLSSSPVAGMKKKTFE